MVPETWESQYVIGFHRAEAEEPLVEFRCATRVHLGAERRAGRPSVGNSE
jgi:hypothetical protein